MRWILLLLLVGTGVATSESLTPKARQQVKVFFQRAEELERQILALPVTKASSVAGLAKLKKQADGGAKQVEEMHFPPLSPGAGVGFMFVRLSVWAEMCQIRAMSSDDKSMTPKTLAGLEKNAAEGYQLYLSMKKDVQNDLK